jgi:hypothetical protein
VHLETKLRKSETCFKGNKLKSSDGKQKKGTSKSECAILSKKKSECPTLFVQYVSSTTGTRHTAWSDDLEQHSLIAARMEIQDRESKWPVARIWQHGLVTSQQPLR